MKPVIIAGAGIAGLSTAIALAAQGFKAHIFEKAPVLSEQGAGLQLGPNATTILRHWGLEQNLLTHACQPESIELHDGITGKSLTNLPIGHFARHHWHAPYLTLHRGDLQQVLYQAVEKNPLIHLQCGARVASFSGNLTSGFEVEVKNKTGIETHQGAWLIACDGVWSSLRGKNEAQFSGTVAWRMTVARKHLMPFFNSQNIQVFMGVNGHFIAYPLHKGQDYNLVAITHSPSAEKADRENLSHCFASWHAPMAEIIALDDAWSHWPLFVRRPPCFLAPCGVVFLGDSAHATTPFAAQGAAMAIEDAACLAQHITNPAALNQQNLEAFAARRYKRVQQVSKRGNFNRFVYHASGAVAIARNLYMRSRSPAKFLTDLDWLYRPQSSMI